MSSQTGSQGGPHRLDGNRVDLRDGPTAFPICFGVAIGPLSAGIGIQNYPPEHCSDRLPVPIGSGPFVSDMLIVETIGRTVRCSIARCQAKAAGSTRCGRCRSAAPVVLKRIPRQKQRRTRHRGYIHPRHARRGIDFLDRQEPHRQFGADDVVDQNLSANRAEPPDVVRHRAIERRTVLPRGPHTGRHLRQS